MSMSISVSSLSSLSFSDSSDGTPITVSATAFHTFQVKNHLHFARDDCFLYNESASKFCRKFNDLKTWISGSMNFRGPKRKYKWGNEFKSLPIQDKGQLTWQLEGILSPGHVSEPAVSLSNVVASMRTCSQHEENSALNYLPYISTIKAKTMKSPLSLPRKHSSTAVAQSTPSLCIAVIGATGHLARRKIFPALFALYYSGYLPENVGIFGYSRRDLTDEDFRSIIASTLTCRLDYQEDCGSKMDAFLSRLHYLNGGYDNREGMSKLNSLMERIEGESDVNRIFYLSVPQEALLDVAFPLADNAQSQKGWNRVLIEKPFGFVSFSSSSSHQLTQSLLSKFEEKQLYRIDHLLGKNIVENVTVLRFCNLVFQPLWNRKYIHNVQVIFSEDLAMDMQGRNFDNYGIISDIIHSHILQTIALLAMEVPVSLDGEDIRNEKVKVIRSIRKLEPTDVILGQYKACSEDKVDTFLNSSTPTFFAAALYIENARWDGVPFLIKAGRGLIKHRVEIRLQFRHVPGNLYREHIEHNIDLVNNELILRDLPDEAILLKLNNKIPGLGLKLDASELNLLYKDKYNVEVPDSYEHLLLDVIDGDNHLFMRSDEVTAAWHILSPILQEIDKKNITPEPYDLGGKGPVKASDLWAKHGVQWVDA